MMTGSTMGRVSCTPAGGLRGLRKVAFLQCGLPIEEVSQVIKAANTTGRNKINYTEFLAATLQTQNMLTDERLWIIYDDYANPHRGGISKSSLKDAFDRIGVPKNDGEIDTIFRDHDINRDGLIDFNEFKAIFVEPHEEVNPFDQFIFEDTDIKARASVQNDRKSETELEYNEHETRKTRAKSVLSANEVLKGDTNSERFLSIIFEHPDEYNGK